MIDIVCAHVFEGEGFEVHGDDLIVRNACGLQMLDHELEQAGFTTAADAGDDFDGLGVLKGDEFVEIDGAVFKRAGICHWPHLLYVYCSTNLKKKKVCAIESINFAKRCCLRTSYFPLPFCEKETAAVIGWSFALVAWPLAAHSRRCG